ncbi:MAG TPA: MMPL family transporter [Myxococcota bacterium]|nr:MMPL family transporter [Myxococcota bacterium]
MSASTLARLGAWIADRPAAVLVVFAALLAAAALYGASAADDLPAGGFEVPGSESDLAVKEAESHFGVGSADVLALYRDPGGDVRNAQFGSVIVDLGDGLLGSPGVVGVSSFFDTGDSSLVSRDGHETLLIVSLAGSNADKLRTLPRIESLLRQVPAPIGVAIGGHVAASLLAQGIATSDILAAEKIALPIAAVLTLLFFRSLVAALLPIAIGAFSLASSAAIVRLGSHFTEIAIFALNVAAFLGLGLSIDYSLLLVQRFREELQRGHSARAAVITALDTAGRSIFISGLAVMVSLVVLLGVPVAILRSVALGGVLATATALVGALLLLPALLVALGPRVDRWSLGRAPDAGAASPFWTGVGRLSMRHPLATGLACGVLLLTISSPVLRMRSVLPDARIFPNESEVRRVDEALADPSRFDPGGASAMQVIVASNGAPLESRNLRLLRAYTARLLAVDGVTAVRTPFASLDPDVQSPAALALAAQSEPVATALERMTDRDRSFLVATGANPWRSAAAAESLEAARAVVHPGLVVKIGGATAQMVDLKLALRRYGRVAAVLVVSWNLLLLLVAFRSVVVPIKAVLMNMLSLGASYGLLVWVFQDGHFARLLGFEPLDGIDPSIPLVMFAVVFGLSMDYEVFLLSRMREEWLRTGDNQNSVIFGLAHTGRIITSAALILLVVIGAFAAGKLVYVKQIGVGMAAAIALDVTVVRALLVPATMQLLGKWNWWAPSWLLSRRESVHVE